MWPIIPWKVAVGLFVLGTALALVAARIIQPAWWKSRWFRVGFAFAIGFTALGMALWTTGKVSHQWGDVHAGAGLAYVGLIVGLPAALVMPFGAGLSRAGAKREGETGVSRRSLLRFGGGALPAAAAASAGSGLLRARSAAEVKLVPMTFDDLHPDLEGFRILQLSDLHLGIELGLEDLERGLETAMREAKPDLIVLTGDLADATDLIAPALERIARAGAKYGAYACLGNHEYHHPEASLPRFKKGPVPLLVGQGRQIKVGRAVLHVGGADDPLFMKGPIAKMLKPTIASSIHGAPPADFKLLLCHRPEGFGPAVEHGYDLTLSGHTHGGQIGLFGRSLLEKVFPDVSWWGTYERGRSRLYTTSGFGHWFPYRFGCPTEMPVVVLGRSPRAGTASLRA